MTSAEHSFSGRGNFTEGFGLKTEPMPLEPYRSRDFFELEQKMIFRRAWLYVCRAEELPEPGNFVVKTIHGTGVSALITRTSGGTIQAFYNSCSHRGSIVVKEDAGKAARFACPYHRWTYSNDGDLVGVPDEENFFPSLDKSKCGLKKIATSEWEGWVFINLAPNPEVTLEEYLGPAKDHLSGITYRGAHNPVVFTAVLDSNWKVASDAFIETYHIPHIHKDTIGTTFASRSNPFARLIGARPLGTHRTVSMYGNPEYAIDPKNRVEALGSMGKDDKSVIAADVSEETTEFLSHPAINPEAADHWSMDVHQIFPHLHIDTGPGGFWTHQFWPVDEKTCFYEVRFYMMEAQSIQERFLQELYIARVGEVVLEDLANLKFTQDGIDTGGQDTMQLQDSEVAIRHALTQVINWTQARTVKEALA